MKIALSLLLMVAIAQGGTPSRLGPLLSKAFPALTDDEQAIVFIYLADKGHHPNVQSSQARQFLTQHAIERRLKVRHAERIVDEDDYPLERSYVDAVAANVVSVRHELKWFNAVSAVATKRQIEALLRLPFVRSIDLVGRWRKRPGDESSQEVKSSPALPEVQSTNSLSYGPSFSQNNQLNVPAVHNYGIHGQGVVIGVFDNGFRLLTHQALASMNIIAQHDFVDHKTSVIPNDPNPNTGAHGINTLSTIGGYFPGQLIGPAFGASFILARTENDSSETPIEEDNWAAAIQWADSIGVDVTSTSLGYSDPNNPYDPPYVSWTPADMNGNTTVITKAADHAVQLGITVLNSAGNAGFNATHNTLGAPADGDSVITVGAVDSNNVRAGFSAVGPTADGRIKPDIVARGVLVRFASATITTAYTNGSGTSFSCPLSAGVAALVLCANPTLTPIQVRTALRQTADNAGSPNNLIGWGLINAMSAIEYYGPLRNGKIRGTVFNDLNGNGVKEGGESGIAGRKVVCTGVLNDSAFTDVNGNFVLDSLPFGQYSIREQLPAGWLQTTPADSYGVALLFGSDSAGFDFGNVSQGSIAGAVFYDVNKNGVLDPGEYPLSGWTVQLSGPVTASVQTDDSGKYAFTNLLPGSYTVSESSQANWLQSLPPSNGSYAVTLVSGLDTAGLNFLLYYSSNDVYYVNQGWNLLSLPQRVGDNLKTHLYPEATSKAFIYDHAYTMIDTIPNSVGYWIKYPSGRNVIITGAVRMVDTIALKDGWNLIGTLSVPIPLSGVQQNPPNVLSSNYFDYVGGTYQIVGDSLRPHRGYWVRASAPGFLDLNASVNAPASAPKTPGLPPMNSVTITDAGRRSQSLCFTRDKSLGDRVDAYLLPPAPPEGAFDARFSNGSLLAVLHDETAITLSASFPITIRWDITDGTVPALVAGEEVLELRGSGSALIAGEVSALRLLGASHERPSHYSLEQNFPNPFNPTTLIRYELPQETFVTLEVYNMFGQKITTLVNGRQQAGEQAVEFTGAALASGIYYYRLTAGEFSEVRRMVLLK